MIKYEFWYNYLHILKHRNVPVYSVSSIFRPSQVFFRWYGGAYRGVLRCITHFYVQNETSRELLNGLGIDCVTVTGDTRFDRVLRIKEQSKILPVVESFRRGCPHVFVAGSSWPPDEDIFIRYFLQHPEWKVIIAPHKIDEDHLQQIEQKLSGRRVVRYTHTDDKGASGAECMIIDCFGLLSSIYHYGDVAYVGGGFGVGIHNILEAAVWNVPVFFGPNNSHFQEAQVMKDGNGGLEISTYEDFEVQMNRLSSDDTYLKDLGERAGQFVKSKAGATQRVLESVNLL